MNFMGRALGLMLTITLVSCGHGYESNMLLPQDTATPEERAQINAVLEELSTLFAAEGMHLDLKSIPVIVPKTVTPYADASGICSKKFGQRYIQINTEAFKKTSRIIVPASEAETHLFSTLLHEIGHCYFNRKHDDVVIYKSGSLIRWTIPTDAEGNDFAETQALPSSIMNSNSYFGQMPKILKTYYVKELLNPMKSNASSLSDFSRYGEFTYTPMAL